MEIAGSSNCCKSGIEGSGRSCLHYDPPCVIELPSGCLVTGYARDASADFIESANMDTLFDCRSHCAQSDECEYFGYSSQLQRCRLFADHGALEATRHDVLAQNFYGPKECPKHKEADTTKIICPYLATLVNEGALPVRDSYSKFELETITVQSGVPAGNVEGHVHGGNFFFNPSGVQNIFDMEGAVNEHVTSTGIHDCATDYSDCPLSTRYDPNGTEKCPGAVTEECELPNVDIFNRFWDHTDADEDGFIDVGEMLNDANNFSDVVDVNEVTGRGTITGGFQDIIRLMGVDADGTHNTGSDNEKMSRETMERVMIQRMFPEHYMYPYLSGGDGFIQLGEWRMGPVADGHFFSFSHRSSDRAVVFNKAGMYFNAGGNNFRLWDEEMSSGQYPSNVEFGSHLTFGPWKIGNIDMTFFGIEKDGENGLVLEATGEIAEAHPEGDFIRSRPQIERFLPNAAGLYFGDRFIQLGNFRLADAGNERFMIGHSAFRDMGITFYEDGSVTKGQLDYDSDVWDRPVEGSCDGMSCQHM